MDTLLFEIGSEEIPAGYIAPALEAFEARLVKKLDDARIAHGEAETFGTPKRLGVRVADVAPRQESLTTEVIGPPAKVAFDENGKPTVAAEKFAEKLGLAVDQLKTRETEKGTYLAGVKSESGQDAIEILKEILPEVGLGLPFPKSMRWGDLDIVFTRPVHYMLAMLGETVIPFQVEGVTVGDRTAGHPFMNPGEIVISNPAEYKEALRSAHVIVDIEERKEMVRKEIARAAGEAGGAILPDEELVDIVTNLVEFPAAVTGKFDDVFLELPDEILITAMREHQKYFAVVDEAGKLMASFIAVNNTVAKDMDLVATGHERVIRARLKDGQ
ncbi:MAG: glycine--tRNA ligase subunit beta, partial [Desulfobacterales bacterium]|nr:glycine--tRNA ligase subunit beta [Desulfobacterales bacterium]